jgi:hypothetical protein
MSFVQSIGLGCPQANGRRCQHSWRQLMSGAVWQHDEPP